MKLLKTFFRLPLEQKRMIPRMLVLMVYYKYLLRRRPFSTLAPKLGTLGCETPVETTPREARIVHELMEAILRRLRWKDSCLIRALTAKRILNSKGLKCTLYMGVSKKEGQSMTAHAWLRCGKCIITGADAMAGYTVTAVFGDK